METSGIPKVSGVENKNTFRIEHLPHIAVIVNLDYPEKGDVDIILAALKKEQTKKMAETKGRKFDLESQLFEIGNLVENGENLRFHVKLKQYSEQHIEFIKDPLKNKDPINALASIDFDRKSRYALIGVTNEIILSKKIKEIVASNAVQGLAKRYGFAGMIFSEPIVAIIDKEFKNKYLIYKRIEQESFIPTAKKNIRELAQELRQLFKKNGIYPHDLQSRQFMITNQDGKTYIVLIDTEAYTKI